MVVQSQNHLPKPVGVSNALMRRIQPQKQNSAHVHQAILNAKDVLLVTTIMQKHK